LLSSVNPPTSSSPIATMLEVGMSPFKLKPPSNANLETWSGFTL